MDNNIPYKKLNVYLIKRSRPSSVVLMNRVDYLLKNPFTSLKQEEKLEIKRLGPHQPKDISFTQVDGKVNRKFNTSLYDSVKWLTISEDKKRLFCFYCVLFRGDTAWSQTGYSDVKHVKEKIAKHQCSTTHMNNAVRYHTFGSVNIAEQIDSSRRLMTSRHNEQVARNRKVLDKVIDCLKFCGTHELALRGHDESSVSYNKGVFLDLMDFISIVQTAEDPGSSSNTFSYTSKTVQNELLQCILDVYKEDLKKDIAAAKFVSIQADETTDISNSSQFVIILRFLKDDKPVERFLTFVNVTDRSSLGLSNTLKEELNTYNLEQKLIAQTYDGASVMSGIRGGVHVLMKEDYQFAYFVHCYAHQLNLILKNACHSSKEIRIFFSSLSAFSSFFSASPKRADILKTFTDNSLPRTVETRWNFHSRILKTVYENKKELHSCFSHITDDDSWDGSTVLEAEGLKGYLEGFSFLFFLSFFYKVFNHVEILYNTLQSRSSHAVKVEHALEHFQATISTLREECEEIWSSIETDLTESNRPKPKRFKQDKTTLIAVAKEACDNILVHIKDRFSSFELIHALSIVDPSRLRLKEACNKAEAVNIICRYYPFFKREQVLSELEVLYSNKAFESLSTVLELRQFLQQSDLADCLPALSDIVQLILTIPVTSAESERSFSTLKRIKTYLRNTIGQERLNALTVLSVHKELFVKKTDFNQRVIDRFATLKTRRAQFMYK